MGASRTTLTKQELAFINNQRVARLATSDAAGHPTAVPVCFACDGARFFIALDEKPKSVDAHKLKRVRNIEARHEASLLIDHYSDDWSQLAYILIHGQAEIISPGHPLHAHALALVRARYPQYRSMKLEVLPVIMVTPRQVSAWGPGLAQ
ncbi:MAG TPA: TIGR03668 family PPOX class F420-dependent oxidoreductase [Ktedonobacteraceae bacterium]